MPILQERGVGGLRYGFRCGTKQKKKKELYRLVSAILL